MECVNKHLIMKLIPKKIVKGCIAFIKKQNVLSKQSCFITTRKRGIFNRNGFNTGNFFSFWLIRQRVIENMLP